MPPVLSPPMRIPLIDLEPWFSGSPDDRAELADLVDSHLREVGFLLVSNHGIADSVFDDARAAARTFFALPSDVKQRYRYDGGTAYRGWVGVGRQSNAGAYGVATAPDVKETFAFGNPDADDELAAAQPQWFAPNVYPDEVAGFRAAVETFSRACSGLVDELLVLLAVALRLEPDTLVSKCRTPISSGNFNWYPPRDALASAPAPDQFRIGPHYDYGTLTVLDREPGLGGLQVRVADEWVTAPWVPGALTINTGLLMGRWSNDRWSPNEHRVLPPPADDPAEELISLVFFHDPDHDAVIRPLDGCVDDTHPPRYEPVVAGEHLATMLSSLSVADDAVPG